MVKPLPRIRPWSCVAVVAGLLASAGVAWACADEGCSPDWQLGAQSYACAGRALLTPGNDTRINLLLLIRSLRPASLQPAAPPDSDWYYGRFGHGFIDWKGLRAALWPHPAAPDAPEPRRVCPDPATPDGWRHRDGEPTPAALAAFAAALADESRLPQPDRDALTDMRSHVGCGTPGWETNVQSALGREYLAYLRATDAFYAGDWAGARAGFAALSHAKSRWVADTAAYMPIRIALRRAMATSHDEYGNFDGVDKVDHAAVAEARNAIAAYLRGYPKGRYAVSARGLSRRVLWLEGNRAELARSYERLIAATPADSEATADLIEETDVYLLGDQKLELAMLADTPTLLAIADLQSMRPTEGKTLAQTTPLADQQKSFGQRRELYDFLLATHAYYSGHYNMARTLIAPAPAPAPAAQGYTPLAFSAQMLRGMALAKTNDGAEVAHWTRLIASSAPLYQRPQAELGLALHWQAEGRMAAVFAPDSAITDPTTREILLETLASPTILRLTAANTARPARERDIARYTLLYKDLTRGAYGDFGRDLALVPADAGLDGDTEPRAGDGKVPLGLFTKGRWAQAGFECPSLAQTARTLAADPLARRARLCLGEFYRLNGFDGFSLYAPGDGAVLGRGREGFGGKPLARDAIYAAVLADPAATPDERAYALYRSVMCYAPSGYNGCAGAVAGRDGWEKAQAPKAQRRAWFNELKTSYPDTRWAKSLRYFW